MDPELLDHDDGGVRRPVLVWRFAEPLRTISSAPLGGGTGRAGWWIDAEVASDYGRTDPGEHLADIAGQLGLAGPGVGMLTAADVAAHRLVDHEGVRVVATTGVSHPTWAAATGASAAPAVGTINIAALVPVPLTEAALVNAVITVTEAKTQALLDAGIDGTGTATDAVCVACPGGSQLEGIGVAAGPTGEDRCGAATSNRSSRPGGDTRTLQSEAFGGPRSTWGARLARAVHAAVAGGLAR